MYIGVDVGGTKTLVAVLDEQGVIKEKIKFPTPNSYDEFLANLKETVAKLDQKNFLAAGVAMPGQIDRRQGRVIVFGNLPWKNVMARDDCQEILGCPVVIENDAKLAGLSESMLLKDKYSKVLYITVSTGIGIALVADGVLDTELGDGGGKNMFIEHRGKSVPWESFASGKAIVERYGKKAEEIDDNKTWRAISRDLAKGLIELIALTEPEVIVIGGSVGTHFDKYDKILNEEVKRFHLPTFAMPKIIGAKRPEEAVVYGCYDLAKQTFGHAKNPK